MKSKRDVTDFSNPQTQLHRQAQSVTLLAYHLGKECWKVVGREEIWCVRMMLV
jgi:hypothetical protein